MLTHDQSSWQPQGIRGDQLAVLEDTADWGPWRLYPPTLVLVLLGEMETDNGERYEYERYEVDLERCLASAEVLDWYHQICHKGWGGDATIAGLVRAIDDVLAPQKHLCSWGSPLTITKQKVAELVGAAAQRRPDLVHVRDDES